MRSSPCRPAPVPVLAALAGVLLAAAGCTGSGGLEFQGDAPDNATRVVVAPSNLALRLAPELEDVVEPVERELIRYLQARGNRVAVIWPPDAWSLWRDAMAAVQNSELLDANLETAATVFLRELTEHADFDFFVMPALVYREARVAGRHASWDGVRRRVSVRTRTAATGGNYLDGSNLVGSRGGRGRIVGLSLHVLVFTPDGELVHQAWGGIDVVHDAVGPGGARGADRLRLQPELIERPEYLREGIEVALGSYDDLGR